MKAISKIANVCVIGMCLAWVQVSPATLVSQWDFNDSNPTTVADVAGGGNPLTIVGTPSYQSTPGTGNFGLRLNNGVSGQGAQVLGTSNLNQGLNGFSYVFFAQIFGLTDLGGFNEVVLANRLNNGPQWTGYFPSADTFLLAYKPLGEVFSPRYTYPANQMVTYVYSWDGTTDPNSLKLYANGVLVKQGTMDSGAGNQYSSSASADFRLGNVTAAVNGLNVLFDEVRFYNSALSESEILALAPNQVIPEPASAGLLVIGLGLVARRMRRSGR